ncbi:MAG TPA: NAD-dependent epimerase/dehydratase family protein, partial [Bacteroidales bacterium]|nr:NAD-dependent epimerase/dehydratase family protein [Bacteroidales bacterium]
MEPKRMNGMVVISGASGLIGRRLQEYFREKGHLVRTIGRAELRLSPAELASRLEGAAVLINLAGAPIAQRWTAAARREIMDSRVLSTRSLVQAIEGMDRPPALLMNASAIGIYTTEGLHTEDSRSFDGGFLGEVCQAWEAAAQPAAE